MFSNGAYRLRPGSFGRPTAGRFARNLLTVPHNDPDQKPARAAADQLGLPHHGGLMPLALADFLVRFLSEEDSLVLDLFGGWGTTAKAAEINRRRWVICEQILQYLLCGKERFRHQPGYFDTALVA